MAAPRYLAQVSGVLTEKAAVQAGPASSPTEQVVSTGTDGLIAASLMPVGIGPEVITVVSSENLSAGDFVNVYDNAGTANVRKADATSPTKPANGFVLAAVTAPASATVYGPSQRNTGITGTPAIGRLFLSASTPGRASATAPSTAGQISQEIGYSYTTTAMTFNPHMAITLA